MRRVVPAVLLTAVVALLVSCGDDAPAKPTAVPTIVGLSLFGAPTASVGVGQAIYLRAAYKYSDNSTVALQAGVTWQSSAPGIVDVSPSGVATALNPGQATITAQILTHSATNIIRVVPPYFDNLEFRVAILNATTTPKPEDDVRRIFAKADDILFERTSARMRIIDMRDVGPGTAANLARAYMDSLTGEQPDGILFWSEEATAVSAGGFSQTLIRPAPYSNRYPPTGGANRVFLSSVHYEHKYGRCGYDTTGANRIGTVSGNGECRNRSGLTCVNNGVFWECPDVRADWYAQPDVFIATVIVHEFMHLVGFAGNDDHYGTETCKTRVGMSAGTAGDTTQFQWHCGQCPDLFQRFRPAGAPPVNAGGMSRSR